MLLPRYDPWKGSAFCIEIPLMTDAERLGGQRSAPGEVPPRPPPPPLGTLTPSAGSSIVPSRVAGVAASGAATSGSCGDPNAIHCVGASFARAAACCSDGETTCNAPPPHVCAQTTDRVHGLRCGAQKLERLPYYQLLTFTLDHGTCAHNTAHACMHDVCGCAVRIHTSRSVQQAKRSHAGDGMQAQRSHHTTGLLSGTLWVCDDGAVYGWHCSACMHTCIHACNFQPVVANGPSNRSTRQAQHSDVAGSMV